LPKGDGIYLTNNLTGKKFLEIVEARKKTNGTKSKKEENNFQSEHNFFHVLILQFFSQVTELVSYC
jgi:hypothetical protein